MKKLILLLAGIFLVHSAKALAWTQKIQCQDSRFQFEIQVKSDSFPAVTGTLVTLSPPDQPPLKLKGRYAQSYDYDEKKSYYGYNFIFTADKPGAKNFLRIRIEDKQSNGFMELLNPLFDPNQITLSCNVRSN
jgi:hypothetical protein